MSKEVFDVEMPDGTVIEDVPKGTTQAEVQRRFDLMKKSREGNLPSFVPPVQREQGHGQPAPPKTIGQRVMGFLPTPRDAAIYGGMAIGGVGGSLIEPGGGTVAGGAAGALAGKDIYDWITGTRSPGEETTTGKILGDVTTAASGGLGLSEIPGSATQATRNLIRPWLEVPPTPGTAGAISEEAARTAGDVGKSAGRILATIFAGGTLAEAGGKVFGSPHLVMQGMELTGATMALFKNMGIWDVMEESARTKIMSALDHRLTGEAMRLLQLQATRLSANPATQSLGATLQSMLNTANQPQTPQGRKDFMDRLDLIRMSHSRPTEPLEPVRASDLKPMQSH